jgi:hypothetical protein
MQAIVPAGAAFVQFIQIFPVTVRHDGVTAEGRLPACAQHAAAIRGASRNVL